MSRIVGAIAAFEKNPNEENAEGLYGACQSEEMLAFAGLPEEEVSLAFLENHIKALHLLEARGPSPEMIGGWVSDIRHRLDVILARMQGNSARVTELLRAEQKRLEAAIT